MAWLSLRSLLVLVALLAPTAWAADKPTIQLYRYVDNRGVTVLDTQGVPAEYMGKGYQILNQQGRVIQTIPPAPTADELKRQQAQKAQADADAELLHLYPTLKDLERAHVREQADLDALIAVAGNNLQSLQIQQVSLQTQAAAQERNGQTVQASIVSQLASIETERAGQNGLIAGYQQRKLKLEQAYAQNHLRMVQLVGDGSTPVAPPSQP